MARFMEISAFQKLLILHSRAKNGISEITENAYKGHHKFALVNLQYLILDLFTDVSQIYGCFFPWDVVTSHFINLCLTMVFQ